MIAFERAMGLAAAITVLALIVADRGELALPSFEGFMLVMTGLWWRARRSR